MSHDGLWRYYFASIPLYGEADFRRCFRMCKDLFTRIHYAIIIKDESYFVENPDALGNMRNFSTSEDDCSY